MGEALEAGGVFALAYVTRFVIRHPDQVGALLYAVYGRARRPR